MSKTETLKRSAAASNEMHIERLANQIEAVRQAKHKSAEDLARALEPLAQAMAELIDQTRVTLTEVNRRTKENGEQFQGQINTASGELELASKKATESAEAIRSAGQMLKLKFYAVAIATGMFSAVLTTGFWFWLKPPQVQNQLDPKEVAEYLRPALTEALRRYNGK